MAPGASLKTAFTSRTSSTFSPAIAREVSRGQLMSRELRYLPFEGGDPRALPPVLGPKAGDDRAGRACRARLRRDGARRPELPLVVDDDRSTGPAHRLAADPGHEGTGLIALRPDPNRLRLRGVSALVADVDIERAAADEVQARVPTDADIRAAGRVLERVDAVGDVEVADPVALQR